MRRSRPRREVVENLLSNARRFTPAPGEVFVRVRPEAGTATIEVSDTGIGFDAELAESLFLPFIQAEQPGAQPGGALHLDHSAHHRTAQR